MVNVSNNVFLVNIQIQKMNVHLVIVLALNVPDLHPTIANLVYQAYTLVNKVVSNRAHLALMLNKMVNVKNVDKAV